MRPLIFDGDVVLVDTYAKTLRNGDVVIVTPLHEEDRMGIFWAENGVARLLHPFYPIVVLGWAKHYSVVGKVVEVRWGGAARDKYQRKPDDPRLFVGDPCELPKEYVDRLRAIPHEAEMLSTAIAFEDAHQIPSRHPVDRVAQVGDTTIRHFGGYDPFDGVLRFIEDRDEFAIAELVQDFPGVLLAKGGRIRIDYTATAKPGDVVLFAPALEAADIGELKVANSRSIQISRRLSRKNAAGRPIPRTAASYIWFRRNVDGFKIFGTVARVTE